jgi:DNA-binding XRE family transcriptional regulator
MPRTKDTGHPSGIHRPFWLEPGGLDLAMARLRPGGRELEIRFRRGRSYVLAVGKLGAGWVGGFAEPSPDARAVVLCLIDGEFHDLPVERLLAACESSYRRELAARAKEVAKAPLGFRVRELRRTSGRTATAVAAAAGMARSNYSRLEAGLHEPRLATLRRVAQALGVQVTALLAAPSRRTASALPAPSRSADRAGGPHRRP